MIFIILDELIKSCLSTATDQEKKIAKCLLRNEDQISTMSIHQFAEIVGVSAPTITRFIKKLGFSGMKQLRASINAKKSTNDHFFNDSNFDPKKIALFNIAAIEKTVNSINNDNLIKVVKKMEKADTIYIFGTGGSRVAAVDANHRFLRLSLNASYITDYHTSIISLSKITKNSVVFIYSHSMSNKTTNNLIKIAKEKGAYIVAITSSSRMSLKWECDIVLSAKSAEENVTHIPFTSRSASITINDILYHLYIIRNRDKIMLKYNETNRLIEELKLK